MVHVMVQLMNLCIRKLQIARAEAAESQLEYAERIAVCCITLCCKDRDGGRCILIRLKSQITVHVVPTVVQAEALEQKEFLEKALQEMEAKAQVSGVFNYAMFLWSDLDLVQCMKCSRNLGWAYNKQGNLNAFEEAKKEKDALQEALGKQVFSHKPRYM